MNYSNFNCYDNLMNVKSKSLRSIIKMHSSERWIEAQKNGK